MAAFGEPQELLTAVTGLAAQMSDLPKTEDIEAIVNSAIEVKLLEAI